MLIKHAIKSSLQDTHTYTYLPGFNGFHHSVKVNRHPTKTSLLHLRQWKTECESLKGLQMLHSVVDSVQSGTAAQGVWGTDSKCSWIRSDQFIFLHKVITGADLLSGIKGSLTWLTDSWQWDSPHTLTHSMWTHFKVSECVRDQISAIQAVNQW